MDLLIALRTDQPWSWTVFNLVKQQENGRSQKQEAVGHRSVTDVKRGEIEPLSAGLRSQFPVNNNKKLVEADCHMIASIGGPLSTQVHIHGVVICTLLDTGSCGNFIKSSPVD